MKKNIISAAILIALSSTQVLADNEIHRDKMKSKGSMYDGDKRELQAQCIKMSDPDGLLDGKYLGVEFEQADSPDMFRFKAAYLMNKEETEACERSAEIMPIFKDNEEDDEHDSDSDDSDSDSDDSDSDDSDSDDSDSDDDDQDDNSER